jgi:hypothetical protein
MAMVNYTECRYFECPAAEPVTLSLHSVEVACYVSISGNRALDTRFYLKRE